MLVRERGSACGAADIATGRMGTGRCALQTLKRALGRSCMSNPGWLVCVMEMHSRLRTAQGCIVACLIGNERCPSSFLCFLCFLVSCLWVCGLSARIRLPLECLWRAGVSPRAFGQQGQRLSNL